jgi:hypothetical protein
MWSTAENGCQVVWGQVVTSKRDVWKSKGFLGLWHNVGRVTSNWTK